MTAPRVWPDNCREARDHSAERAVAGMMALNPLINGTPLSDKETMRRIAVASFHFQQIARMLEKVGATSTDPLSENL